MRYSTIFTLIFIIAITQATAIAARNLNHISMYETNSDKYYKWKNTSTCAYVAGDLRAASVYTDHEPLQEVIAFSNGNCKQTLGRFSKNKCVATTSSFGEGAIGSVMLWLPKTCDFDLADAIDDLLELGGAIF